MAIENKHNEWELLRMAGNKPILPHRMQQAIVVDGTELNLIVERKQVKNVNARLRGTTMMVSAPHKMSQAVLDEAIADLARRLVRRAHAQHVNQEEDAAALVQRVATRFAGAMPHPPEVTQVLFVTTQQARWGSYSHATKTIRLNAVLRRMPRWVLESVVAHELAHVVHADHSPAFWKLTRRVCPETDRARAFLSGVSWLGQHLTDLPAIERSLLAGIADCEDQS